jgi:hypothetical protein
MSKNGRLTHKQLLFVQSYLIHSNASRAACEAGYSAKSASSIGYENLTKPYILERVEKGRREQLEKADITADCLLLELRKIVNHDPLFGPCPGNKLQAIKLYGQAIGLFQNKTEAPLTQFSASDLLEKK